MKRLFFILLFLTPCITYSQTFSSVNNQTGLWSEEATWQGGTPPTTSVTGNIQIEINGSVVNEGNLSMGGTSDLIIQDTLWVNGDLDLNGSFTLLVNGVLVVTGDLEVGNNASFTNNGISIIKSTLGYAGDIENYSNLIYAYTAPVNRGGSITPTGNSIKSENDLSTENPIMYNYATIDPLPVELYYFNASQTKEGVRLEWATLSELNNAYFEVQRSFNGTGFTTIAKIKGQGNSNVLVEYSYTDPTLLPSRVFYRLKQVDFDQKYAYSHLQSVSPTQDIVKLFPSPAYDFIKVYPQSLIESSTTFEIYDSNGSSVFKQQGYESSLPISQFKSGLCFLHIYTDGHKYVEKFMISH
ncbi:T9SS type A sorting domain-containing protein [Fulvivirga maritima]|uniref:T9SS type A sorting domain-containing protein n=1 Tax=Fulvivirga maritima TaxID=2904247 RepID=UPI001F461E4F|nr:T9SS type A sorting domain-containing protein [Fulvivirga maritima]UII25814.1 T9SS type A sorting domain-containing protein [Fulvivirga maritima]